MSGKLYLVPTPIGNLKDITLRALEVIEQADLIAAEDTRQTLKLLNHYDIKKPLISYHQHNEQGKSMEIIDKLKEGLSIALVTDAGTPGISDPGAVIVKRCIEEGLKFEVLPGATAITTALVYSGLDTTGFIFKGFIPRGSKERKEFLEGLCNERDTLVFYEAPHRLRSTLQYLLDSLGNREIAICRELTKRYEEIIRLSIAEAIEHYNKVEPRGEYVLVVAGKSLEKIEAEQKEKWENMSVEQHIIMYMEAGLSKKDAVKLVAKERNVSKSIIYKHSLGL